jgi:hypothetical protein
MSNYTPFGQYKSCLIDTACYRSEMKVFLVLFLLVSSSYALDPLFCEFCQNVAASLYNGVDGTIILQVNFVKRDLVIQIIERRFLL